MRTSLSPRTQRSLLIAAIGSIFIAASGLAAAAPTNGSGTATEHTAIADDAAARADCGPGSLPETGLQGDVPAGDRDSGRSKEGYRCNISALGGFAGRGAGIISASLDNCAYLGTIFPGDLLSPKPGVQVLDVSDTANPVHTATLDEPAMLAGTWESLKVNAERKLLVGTGVPALTGYGLLSVYDISDCAHPRLLNPGAGTNLQMPLPITSHEGGFSPDGKTYWASGTTPGIVSAVDLADPANPRVIWQGLTGLSSHGFGMSPDGNRMYLSNTLGGITVVDTSAVQRRDPNPQVHDISRLSWTDGRATQHSIPVTYGDTPYLFTPDEGGSGGVKIIDISDETKPRIANSIKLEINLTKNQDTAFGSSSGGSIFAYDPHYCAADRPVDPTALACGWISSGIRVFDVRDPLSIREIAYYNPPAMTGQNLDRTNSAHAMASLSGVPYMSAPVIARAIEQGQFNPDEALTPRAGMVFGGDLSSDWCFSPPEWRGTQLWVACSDNGFMALQLDNGVYTPPADQSSTVGS